MDEDNVEELKAAFEEHSTAVTEGIEGLTETQKDLKARLDHIERVAARPRIGALGDPVFDEERKAFIAYVRKGAVSPEMKALTVGSDPAGGFTVVSQIGEAINKIIFETSPMRQYARVITIGTDAYEEIFDADQPDAAWVAETAARPETDTGELKKRRVPVHEIYAAPKASQQLLEDSQFNIEQWLTSKVGERFSRKENAAFVNGSGVGQPRGLLSYPTAATSDATRAWGTLEHVASGASGAFTASSPMDKLVDLTNKLKAGHRAGAVWMMNRTTAGIIQKFKDGQGNYLWQPNNQAGQPPVLLGFPLVFAEDFPALGADSLSIAFGDFMAGYDVIDRNVNVILRDPYTAKPYIVFYMRRRTGGDIANFEAIKLMKFAVA